MLYYYYYHNYYLQLFILCHQIGYVLWWLITISTFCLVDSPDKIIIVHIHDFKLFVYILLDQEMRKPFLTLNWRLRVMVVVISVKSWRMVRFIIFIFVPWFVRWSWIIRLRWTTSSFSVIFIIRSFLILENDNSSYVSQGYTYCGSKGFK